MLKIFSSLLLALAVTGCSVLSPTPEDQAKAAEKWVKLGEPGENHKILERLLGVYKVETSFWSKPELPPYTSVGSSQFAAILGGRFIEERHSGSVGDRLFEGVGLYGYDNALSHFSNTWTDSLNTSIISSIGRYDKERDLIVFKGPVYDPILEEEKDITTVLRFISANQFSVALYEEGRRGALWKTVEMVYTKNG